MEMEMEITTVPSEGRKKDCQVTKRSWSEVVIRAGGQTTTTTTTTTDDRQTDNSNGGKGGGKTPTSKITYVRSCVSG